MNGHLSLYSYIFEGPHLPGVSGEEREEELEDVDEIYLKGLKG